MFIENSGQNILHGCAALMLDVWLRRPVGTKWKKVQEKSRLKKAHSCSASFYCPIVFLAMKTPKQPFGRSLALHQISTASTLALQWIQCAAGLGTIPCCHSLAPSHRRHKPATGSSSPLVRNPCKAISASGSPCT